jgi:hypothetical protein
VKNKSASEPTNSMKPADGKTDTTWKTGSKQKLKSPAERKEPPPEFSTEVNAPEILRGISISDYPRKERLH